MNVQLFRSVANGVCINQRRFNPLRWAKYHTEFGLTGHLGGLLLLVHFDLLDEALLKHASREFLAGVARVPPDQLAEYAAKLLDLPRRVLPFLVAAFDDGPMGQVPRSLWLEMFQYSRNVPADRLWEYLTEVFVGWGEANRRYLVEDKYDNRLTHLARIAKYHYDQIGVEYPNIEVEPKKPCAGCGYPTLGWKGTLNEATGGWAKVYDCEFCYNEAVLETYRSTGILNSRLTQNAYMAEVYVADDTEEYRRARAECKQIREAIKTFELEAFRGADRLRKHFNRQHVRGLGGEYAPGMKMMTWEMCGRVKITLESDAGSVTMMASINNHDNNPPDMGLDGIGATVQCAIDLITAARLAVLEGFRPQQDDDVSYCGITNRGWGGGSGEGGDPDDGDPEDGDLEENTQMDDPSTLGAP